MRRLQRRRGLLLSLALLVILCGLIGADACSYVATCMAARDFERAAIGRGQQWLAWAAWWKPDDGTVDLLHAFAFRHRQQVDGWIAAMEAAQRKGCSTELLSTETQLQWMFSGEMPAAQQGQPLPFHAESVTEYDVPTAVLHGFLANRWYDRAHALLTAWERRLPANAHVAYLWGRYWQARGVRGRAVDAMETALERDPYHELAGEALAEMLDESDQWDRAFGAYLSLAESSPANSSAVAGVSRLLRKAGLTDLAEAFVSEVARRHPTSAELAGEMGRLEFERGNYAEATSWLRRSDLGQVANIDRLATSVALQGDPHTASEFFDYSSGERNRVVLASDLRTRRSLERDRPRPPVMTSAAAPDGAVLDGPVLGDAVLGELAEIDGTGLQPHRPAEAASGAELYQFYCVACHGEQGRGDGRGARHLYPPPRDLRREPMRLVSTSNGVPTREDIRQVLSRGIPGTSMPRFANLSNQQLRRLTTEVLRLRHEGAIELSMRSNADSSSADQVLVGPLIAHEPKRIPLPAIGEADALSLARGRALYESVGCISCHGSDGTGSSDATWYDSRQRPLRPRDLVHEPLKGGNTVADIYWRIVAGMPGTPHPALRAVSPKDTIALVHYCRSLAKGSKAVLTNRQRASLARGDAYQKALRRHRS